MRVNVVRSVLRNKVCLISSSLLLVATLVWPLADAQAIGFDARGLGVEQLKDWATDRARRTVGGFVDRGFGGVTDSIKRMTGGFGDPGDGRLGRIGRASNHQLKDFVPVEARAKVAKSAKDAADAALEPLNPVIQPAAKVVKGVRKVADVADHAHQTAAGAIDYAARLPGRMAGAVRRGARGGLDNIDALLDQFVDTAINAGLIGGGIAVGAFGLYKGTGAYLRARRQRKVADRAARQIVKSLGRQLTARNAVSETDQSDSTAAPRKERSTAAPTVEDNSAETPVEKKLAATPQENSGGAIRRFVGRAAAPAAGAFVGVTTAKYGLPLLALGL